MLTDRGTRNLWEATAPPAPPSAPLSGEVTAEVAIIGAGYTGLSCALHLAEAGVNAAVLEAAGIGHGGSGRNVGLVNAGFWLPPAEVVARLGPEAGPRVIAALGDGPGLVFDLIDRFGIPCEAERAGTLHLATDAKGLASLRERAAQWQALGAPVRLLDDAETAQRTGARGYLGALHDARAGTVQPLAYARGLAAAAMGLGARVFTESPVLRADRAGAGWRLATPGGAVTAGRVVVATNAWAGTVPGAPWGELARALTILPYFQIATAPLRQDLAATVLPGREGCWDTATVMTSFRRDARGRLVLGSIGALGGFDGGAHRGYIARMLARTFPDLGPVEWEGPGWHGRIGMTRDALPRFWAPDAGVVAVGGYNGRGIAPGTVLGRDLARMLLGAAPLLAPRPPELDPLRGLRGGALRLGAMVAHAAGRRLG